MVEDEEVQVDQVVEVEGYLCRVWVLLMEEGEDREDKEDRKDLQEEEEEEVP